MVVEDEERKKNGGCFRKSRRVSGRKQRRAVLVRRAWLFSEPGQTRYLNEQTSLSCLALFSILQPTNRRPPLSLSILPFMPGRGSTSLVMANFSNVPLKFVFPAK